MNESTVERLPIGSMAFENVYLPAFDVNTIAVEQRELIMRHAIIKPFPVGWSVILSILTFGFFALIQSGIRHSQLPHVKSDDFAGGKGVGFLFIPFYNLYWLFVFWLRLADRINLQFKLRNQPAPVPRGLALAASIIGVIPYIQYISIFILYPILIGYIQSACNKLAVTRDTSYFPRELW